MYAIDQRLKDLSIDLPTPSTAVANYLPFYRGGSLLIISGQLPLKEGAVLYKGLVGTDLTLEQGQEAARLCAINILAQVKVACEGDWSRVQQCIRLGGFVACTSTFTDQPKVINGASDLMVALFGDQGRHARVAIGVSALPLNAAVEVEALFCIT